MLDTTADAAVCNHNTQLARLASGFVAVAGQILEAGLV